MNTVYDHSAKTLFDLVAERISEFARLAGRTVIAAENIEKYRSSSETSEMHLRIFENLYKINKSALSDPALCKSDSGKSFVECLSKIVTDLADRARDKKILYIELGPEPAKTSVVLAGLIKHAAEVKYVAVDINATSRAFVVDTISKVVKAENVTFTCNDYRKIDRQIVNRLSGANDDWMCIVTSMGSQEGNEHPFVMHDVYRSIALLGDFVLSEMQILPPLNHSPIFHFSHHPTWVEVSKAYARLVWGNIKSTYGTMLFPIELPDVGKIECAVATEVADRSLGESVLISNYCLKYSIGQLRELRRRCGFSIVSEEMTGDESVVFHLLGMKT